MGIERELIGIGPKPVYEINPGLRIIHCRVAVINPTIKKSQLSKFFGKNSENFEPFNTSGKM